MAAESSPTLPNIIFILADDQRNDELGCVDSILQTPSIDRLAAEGVRFCNAFVSAPICLCSRASIFTGLSLRTHQWQPNGEDSHSLSDAMLESSFPCLLREAGYYTGFFGKNHVDFVCGLNSAYNRMFDQWEFIYRNPYFKEMPDGTLRHTADLIGDRSVAFLEAQHTNSPFFLYMSFNVAHAEDSDLSFQYPWPHSADGMYETNAMPTPRLTESFAGLPDFLKTSLNRARWYWRWDTTEKFDRNIRDRYRMLTGMDNVIGRVMGVLEQQGLAENTVVIYSADNGVYRGDRSLAGKWSHFEESLRVPLIICDPRRSVELRGRTVDSLAVNLDLPSTILTLAGVDVPDTYQGLSLEPFLDENSPADWRTDFFCEHYQFGNVIPSWSGVRSEKYLYACYDKQTPPVELLYNLEQDPDELENLAESAEYSDVLNDLRNRSQLYIEQYTIARDGLRPIPSGPQFSLLSNPDGSERAFDGATCFKLCDLPILTSEDSCVWQFETFIDSANEPGAVLIGNRETPGKAGLNFIKITSDRGAQLFGGSFEKSCILPALLPREQWIRVKLQKQGPNITLFVDGESVSSGVVNFSLSAMPCYLGGDPNADEFARCLIRNASVSGYPESKE